jgi:hypothetical protein
MFRNSARVERLRVEQPMSFELADREGDAGLARSTNFSNDPDRSMATSGGGSGVVGCNVQVAVDSEHHTGSDRRNLPPWQSRRRPVLGADHLDAVADRGYFNSLGKGPVCSASWNAV